MTVRVVLADDHQIFRDALGKTLSENGVELVGGTGNGREAVEMAKELSPDIIVMDIHMPLLNGIEATRQIRSQAPGTRVIVLSMLTDQTHVVEALQAGAHGYVIKQSALEELLVAIRSVQEDHLYLSPSVLAPVVAGYLEWVASQGMPPLHRLTKREREVLQLIAEGMNTQEAAHELELGVRTVESHRSSLMEKLGLTNVVELVHLAFQLGIVRTDS